MGNDSNRLGRPEVQALIREASPEAQRALEVVWYAKAAAMTPPTLRERLVADRVLRRIPSELAEAVAWVAMHMSSEELCALGLVVMEVTGKAEYGKLSAESKAEADALFTRLEPYMGARLRESYWATWLD